MQPASHTSFGYDQFVCPSIYPSMYQSRYYLFNDDVSSVEGWD